MEFEQIVALVWSCTFLVGLIIALICAMIYGFVLDNLRKEHISKLDEHDKSVIFTYVHIKPSFDDFKKKVK